MARHTSKKTTDCPVVNFSLVTPGGPTLSNHAACLLDGVLYIHGGIDKRMSVNPLSKIYCLDLKTDSPIWQEIRAEGSPALSHHCAVVLENRYFVLIGGWDGRVRSYRVFAYDTRDQCWISPETSGMAEGAGLSSHTATVLENGEILVIGREGSTRLQRHFGNIWLLNGSIKRGQFVYQEQEMNLNLASRSGHTTHLLGSTLAIIGGRTDQNIETHKGFKPPVQESPDHILSKLDAFARTISPMPVEPCGRKQHISASAAGVVLLHGGETFDGKSREPVDELFLVRFRPSVQWFRLGGSGIARAGHVCCADRDRIVIHGGMGPKWQVKCDTYQVMIR